MRKRVFLSILVLLAGMYPAVYCADHGGDAFEPNIQLPLQGERIQFEDYLSGDYAAKLGVATFATTTALSYFLINRYMLPSVGKDVPYSQLIKFLSHTLAVGSTTFLGGCLGFGTFLKCTMAAGVPIVVGIARGTPVPVPAESGLAVSARLHNVAIGAVGGRFVDNNGQRTLIMVPTNHADMVLAYDFDRLRSERHQYQEALLADWRRRILFGPENMRRIQALNEKLDALDGQLVARNTVKSAKR